MPGANRCPSFFSRGASGRGEVGLREHCLELPLEIVFAPLDFPDDGLVVAASNRLLQAQENTAL